MFSLDGRLCKVPLTRNNYCEFFVHNGVYFYNLHSYFYYLSMKSPLNDRRFINRRNFLNEQVPSAEVIYNDAVHTQRSTADTT